MGCQQVSPRHELLRFVLVAGRLQPDPAGRAPGRGAWLHPNPQCAAAARKRGGFARSLRVRVDDAALDELIAEGFGS